RGALLELGAQDAVDVVRSDRGARVELGPGHAGGGTVLTLASTVVGAVLRLVRAVLGALVCGGVLVSVRAFVGVLLLSGVICSSGVHGLLLGTLLTGLLVVAWLLRVAAGGHEHQQRHTTRSGRAPQSGHQLRLHVGLPSLPARTGGPPPGAGTRLPCGQAHGNQ